MSSKYDGLKYIGNSNFGVSLMLFNSYTKVDVLPQVPYYFKDNDDQSDEAIAFYKRIRVSCGVELFKDNNKPTTEDPNEEVTTEVTTDNVNDDKVVDEVVVPDEVVSDKESTEDNKVVANNDVDLTSLSDEELSEYIEMNYPISYIKSMVTSIDGLAKVGRKSASVLISLVVPSNKDKVLEYLSNNPK